MPAFLTSRLGSLRSFTTTTHQQIKNRVPEYQKIFQVDNDLPVHLKRGPMDTWLYRFTMALSAFGACYSIVLLVKAAFPKKSE
uniref:Cytochrome c oxidase subunit 7A1, mitochondrial n=1 Tax=Pelusios castaneus TaxID=367368 RepID=A0A8C8R6R9_9SAUR